MGRRAELVFIPCPAVGHLMSTVEFAKLLVDRDEGLSVAVLVMRLSNNSTLRAIIDSVSASSAAVRIRFIELPEPESRSASGFDGIVDFLNSIEGYKPSVRDAVLGLAGSNPAPDSPRLAGLVVDLICTSMIDVANELGIPSYVFYTASASFLGAIVHLQALHDIHQGDLSLLREPDTTLDYPGFANPLPAKLLPLEMWNQGASTFLGLARRFQETKGVMVNTVEELDYRAIEYVFDDKLPKLYPVGPILNLKGCGDDKIGSDDILEWLDSQPPESVVFLCFGSMGSFPEDQVRQIADALEKSSHRFLWSLRRPAPVGKFELPSSYENLEEVLPEGFLDRTAGKGKVIGWAPQVRVLAHPAIGGFVSHCGWNSALESIWFGVPMATWPMFAEQHFNAFALVDELGMAVEIRMDYRRDYITGNDMIIPAEEIERGIRLLMGTENAEKKEKVKQMSERCRKALMEGGSSYTNLGRFIKDVYSNICI